MANGVVTRALRGWACKLLALTVVTAGALFLGHDAFSQTSPGDLMQIFQNLPQDQQDAILKQLGGMGGGGASGILNAIGGSAAGGGEGGGKGLAKRPTAVSEAQQAETNEENEPPGLKGEDWVIVQVTRPPAKPTPAPTPTVVPPAIPGIAAPTTSSSGANAAAAQNSLASLLAATATGPASPTGGATEEPKPTTPEYDRLQALIDLIRSKNPYRLSREGALSLPGFAPIPLLGLSDEQATLRLSVEPALHGIDIRLTRLPLRRSGAEGLKPFGYDLFGKKPTPGYGDTSELPVPSGYVVGPGDELEVQLYGNQNRTVRLVVGRDGNVSFPEIGPVNVAGQPFLSVKAELEQRVQGQLIGTRANVAMGDTRSIRVFVLGEAKRPGSYVVGSLGTITTALYAAGGVQSVGSLRNIALMRSGSLVRRFDLYDLLIRGDSSSDVRLQQDDVVFIPPVGGTIGVVGEVRRPAIYEVRGESTVADVVQLAGGLTPNADRSDAALTRIDERQHRVVLPVDLSNGTRGGTVRDGDLISIMRLRPTLDSGILVQGYLYSPGAFAWHSGIRLTDVLRSLDELRPNADIHYVLIRRETPPDRHISVVSADLAAALAAPGSKADVELMPRDRITVFDLESGRDRIIHPVLDELRLQGTAASPSQVVNVEGRVKVPGEYPLEPGMTVSDLVRAGGGTSDAAYAHKAELIRYQVVNGEARRTELLSIDLAAALQGNPKANLQLQPYDMLSVQEVPEWTVQESVTLRGEVRFPGTYAIRRGETLKSVLGRAGGLTPYAFADGAVFTRDELKRREQEQLDMLADRMQRDVALLALQSAGAGQAGAATALSVGQSLLVQLKSAHAVGRLVIDLPRLESAAQGSTYDVVLRGGDTLSVPRYEQQVTVIGEVQNVTSHLYHPNLTRDDYVALSGGLTRNADGSKIYVVRASGSVIAAGGNRWFQRGDVPIKPGDTIVVPLNTEHIPALPLWTQVTQILYNVAVAILAIRSV